MVAFNAAGCQAVAGGMAVGVSKVRNVVIFTALAVHEECWLLNCLPFNMKATQSIETSGTNRPAQRHNQQHR